VAVALGGMEVTAMANQLSIFIASIYGRCLKHVSHPVGLRCIVESKLKLKKILKT
jgi:hypothetical protein